MSEIDQPFAPDTPRPPQPFISEISEAAAKHFRVSVVQLQGGSRKREVVRPRQVAMYLSRQLTPRSLPEIGRRFGGRDHTTVIHAGSQVEHLISIDDEFAAAVVAVRTRALELAAARAASVQHEGCNDA